MNLAQKIHETWAADATLNGLLPAARFFTGRIPPGTANPCARLDLPGSATGKQSDKAVERAIQVRILHWTDEDKYADGQAIQDAIEEAFQNQTMALEDSTLVNLHHGPSYFLQVEEATDREWQFVTEFTATVQKDRAR